MIAHLRGRIVENLAEGVVMEIGGFAFELVCSSNTASDLELDREVVVHTYLHVREDALQLFGFSTRLEKKLFLSLIKVNGVGPKMATQMLSGAPIHEIVRWIEAGDAKALTQLPKVGKRTAEQLVLTLRGRLVKWDEPGDESSARLGVREDVISALVNLGFRPADVDRVVQDIPKDYDVERAVREGLQRLSP